MRKELIFKPVGGRMTAFTVPAGMIAWATAHHGDHHFMIHALHDWRFGIYWFELRQSGPKRIIESIADREGFLDKPSVITGIRAAALAAELDGEIKKVVDKLRAAVISQIEAYCVPPNEWELLQNWMRYSTGRGPHRGGRGGSKILL